MTHLLALDCPSNFIPNQRISNSPSIKLRSPLVKEKSSPKSFKSVIANRSSVMNGLDWMSKQDESTATNTSVHRSKTQKSTSSRRVYFKEKIDIIQVECIKKFNQKNSHKMIANHNDNSDEIRSCNCIIF